VVACGWIEKDGQANMTPLIVPFRNFAMTQNEKELAYEGVKNRFACQDIPKFYGTPSFAT
jgi:hypothetical protein